MRMLWKIINDLANRIGSLRTEKIKVRNGAEAWLIIAGENRTDRRATGSFIGDPFTNKRVKAGTGEF
jgi:hypothetical protein